MSISIMQTILPREKLLKYGSQHLEGRELVAAILGSGTKGAHVFRIAKKAHKLIQKKGVQVTQADLQNIKGIGPLKALQIISSFELAKRHFVQDAPRIQSSADVYRQVSERANKKQEYLICLTLDGAHRLINKHVVSIGTLTKNLAHPREIFAPAIEERAHQIALAHNHPSGTLEPSAQDVHITQKIKQTGYIIGIPLLDHLIITKDDYRSFKEHNML